MNKKIWILMLHFLTANSAYKSQIMNGDFENWPNATLPGWAIDLTGEMHYISGNAHSGNSALLCKVWDHNGMVFRDAFTKMYYSSNSTYFESLNGKPSSLTGWFFLNGFKDSIHVDVMIKSGNNLVGSW